MMQEVHPWQSKKLAGQIDLLEFPESLQFFRKDKSADYGSHGSDFNRG